MPSVEDFTFGLSAIVTGAITVVAVLAGAFLMRLVLRRVIRRAITARIPRIREESPEQLAARSQTLASVVNPLVSNVIWLLAGLIIIGELGVNIAPLLAAVGLASLALGFAAQNIIRDFLHGFFILAEDWYRVGEVAVVAGIGGLVVDISLRRTVLRDLNGAMHSIPNSQIVLASNLTRDWARINLNVPVAYKEDLERVIRVIDEVGQDLKDDPTLICS